MKKEKMERIAFLLILGLGLLYAYVNYFFLPQWANIQKTTTLLADRQKYLERLQSRAGNMTALQQEIQELERQRNALADQIPGRLDKPVIMADLYNLAKAHNVSPGTLTFGDVQSKNESQELSLTFTGTGSSADILNMISDIIIRPGPKLAVRGVNLTTQEDGIMGAELKLISYATAGGKVLPAEKPSFMNASFGVDNAAEMFQP